MTVPFRAGRASAAIAPHTATAGFTGPVTLLADVSEFQPQIADAVYLGWSKAIVIRAAYGAAHDDQAWYGGQRRDLLHAGGVRFLGIYGYLVAGQDGAAQADALAALVGPLRQGEVLIADFEEGQRAMLTAWYNRMASHGYPLPQLWTYSGLNFGTAAGVMPVEWVAAYGQSEPSPAHKLWQFTDAYSVPGVGVCDCSVFHGSIDQLSALAYQPGVTPPPVPPVTYPVPTGLSETIWPTVDLTWDADPDPAKRPTHWRYQVFHGHAASQGAVVAQNVVYSNHATVTVPGPGSYCWTVQAPNSPFAPLRDITA